MAHRLLGIVLLLAGIVQSARVYNLVKDYKNHVCYDNSFCHYKGEFSEFVEDQFTCGTLSAKNQSGQIVNELSISACIPVDDCG